MLGVVLIILIIFLVCVAVYYSEKDRELSNQKWEAVKEKLLDYKIRARDAKTVEELKELKHYLYEYCKKETNLRDWEAFSAFAEVNSYMSGKIDYLEDNKK